MQVKDIMSKNVLTLKVNDSLDLVDDMMKIENIRHIPVVDEDNLLAGIISHRDLLKASISSWAKVTDNEQRDIYRWIPVKDAMSTKVLTVTSDTEVSEAADMMLEEKIGCLVVVDGDTVTGIVTETDFVQLANNLVREVSI